MRAWLTIRPLLSSSSHRTFSSFPKLSYTKPISSTEKVNHATQTKKKSNTSTSPVENAKKKTEPKDKVKKTTTNKTSESTIELIKKEAPKRLVPPKRPMNIMQLVTQDVISEVQAQEGKLSKESAKNCFRVAADRYKNLNEADKQSYHQRLEDRRVEYEKEMKEFLSGLSPEDYVNQNEYVRRRKALGRSSGRRGIPRIDPEAPKRPLNGFMIFCAEIRSNPSKFPEFDSLLASHPANQSVVTEGSKMLADYWRNLNPDLKQDYINEGQRRSELYKELKAQYDARLSKPKSTL